MASMREVAELFKEKGIPFSPRTFDAYLRGASLEELIPKEEKKDNHILNALKEEKKDNHVLNALKAYSVMPGDDKLYPFF